MILWNEDRLREETMGPPLKKGGEAMVYKVNDTTVAKIFMKPDEHHRHEKCRAWIANPPLDVPTLDGSVKYAMPQNTLLDRRGGEFRGYLMWLVRNPVELTLLCDPGSPLFQPFTTRVIMAYRLSVILDELVRHPLKPVFTDLNGSNVLFSPNGLPTLIDNDSHQITNSSGKVLRTPIRLPEYLPPELQRQDLSTIDRTVYHHNFAFSVMVHEILRKGVHPHDSVNHPEDTPGERIFLGDFPHSSGARYAPSPLAPPFESLSPEIRELFLMAFELGHKDPSARPSPGKWAMALKREIDHPYQAKSPAKPLSISVPAHVRSARVPPMAFQKFRIPAIPWVRVGTYVVALAVGLTAQALLSGNLVTTFSRWLGTVSRSVHDETTAREVPVVVQGPPFIKRLRQEMQDEANGSRPGVESGSSTPEQDE